MSSVLKPLEATAAARLMAVVVFPTPPFWLATVMIMNCLGFYTVGRIRDQGFVMFPPARERLETTEELDWSHSRQPETKLRRNPEGLVSVKVRAMTGQIVGSGQTRRELSDRVGGDVNALCDFIAAK